MTAAELVRVAERAGFQVTRRQIERWHHAGLLPSPTQRHVSGVRGSVSVYPPGTDRPLLALCRWRARRRKLHELAFRLWWEGYAIQPRTLRESLGRLMPSTGKTGRAHGKADSPDARAERAAIALSANKRDPTVRRLRRHLRNPEDVYSAVFNVMLVAFGETPPWGGDGLEAETGERTVEELIFVGWGLTHAAGTWIPGGAGDVPAVFDALCTGGIQDIDGLSKLIDGASDEELVTARQDARMLTEDLPLVVRALVHIYGGDAAGLKALSALRSEDAGIQASMVAVCLALRRSLGSAGFAHLRETMARLAPAAREFLHQWASDPAFRRTVRNGRRDVRRQATALLAGNGEVSTATHQ